jgi:hypothetical protein
MKKRLVLKHVDKKIDELVVGEFTSTVIIHSLERKIESYKETLDNPGFDIPPNRIKFIGLYEECAKQRINQFIKVDSISSNFKIKSSYSKFNLIKFMDKFLPSLSD